VPFVIDAVHRLEAEPGVADLARGFAAEVADPAWLLGRQWQLGEHQGEDASSPVRVVQRASLWPVDPVDAGDGQDPATTPAEAIVESEPEDFWTAGRRVSAGRRVAAAAAAKGTPLPQDPALDLRDLPASYEPLDGTGPDGRELWRRRAALGLAEEWFGDLPPPAPPADMWDPAEFCYNADFTAAGRTLTLRRHDGGDLDWYSVDASGPLSDPDPLPKPVEIIPNRLVYPGAPAARWWQIEDAAVDVGGYPPDRAHLATLLLIDLIASHSDDWFTYPIEALAGHVSTVHEAVVVDSFGDEWKLKPPADAWTMFATEGLDPTSLVVWATTGTPLTGPVLDEVVVGVDEDANLVWAVETRLRGRDAASPAEADPPPADLDTAARRGYAYHPATRVPPHWHPYVIEEIDGRRRFVQGRAVDLSTPVPATMPPPAGDLLNDPASGGVHPVHQMEPAALPSDGLRLKRRAVLARRTDGTPVLWTQRRRHPLLTPPAHRLRHDILEPVPVQG
jgi:hypothetical protein